jgi:hypothetical protein
MIHSGLGCFHKESGLIGKYNYLSDTANITSNNMPRNRKRPSPLLGSLGVAMSRIAKCTWGAAYQQTRTLFTAVVASRMDYAAIIWHKPSKQSTSERCSKHDDDTMSRLHTALRFHPQAHSQSQERSCRWIISAGTCTGRRCARQGHQQLL